MKGWVYVITNPAMTGICKVGFTTKSPAVRARELNNTGVPEPYRVEYQVHVDDPERVESIAHQLLQEFHVHNGAERRTGTEWFKCSVDDAVLAVKQSASGRVMPVGSEGQACKVDEQAIQAELAALNSKLDSALKRRDVCYKENMESRERHEAENPTVRISWIEGTEDAELLKTINGDLLPTLVRLKDTCGWERKDLEAFGNRLIRSAWKYSANHDQFLKSNLFPDLIENRKKMIGMWMKHVTESDLRGELRNERFIVLSEMSSSCEGHISRKATSGAGCMLIVVAGIVALLVFF